MTDLRELAEQLSAFARKVDRVADNSDSLPASGQAIAVALLTVTNLEAIKQATAALRALASEQEKG